MTRQVITSLFALRECQILSRFTTSFYIFYPCCFTVLLTEDQHASQWDKIVRKICTATVKCSRMLPSARALTFDSLKEAQVSPPERAAREATE